MAGMPAHVVLRPMQPELLDADAVAVARGCGEPLLVAEALPPGEVEVEVDPGDDDEADAEAEPGEADAATGLGLADDDVVALARGGPPPPALLDADADGLLLPSPSPLSVEVEELAWAEPSGETQLTEEEAEPSLMFWLLAAMASCWDTRTPLM
jgi:hypothetical protein